MFFSRLAQSALSSGRSSFLVVLFFRLQSVFFSTFLSWLLLRYSAEPFVNHALRTLPPLLSFPVAVDHDVTLWQSLLALLDFAPAPEGGDLPS